MNWSQDPAEPISSQPPPVDPGAVALQLEVPGGGLIPLEPVPGSPGVFRAAAVVLPGSGYSLQGQVAGTPIQGSTIVPATPTIVAPAGDTVDMGPCFPCSLTVEWQAQGAAALEVQVRRGTGQGSTLLGIGVLRASPGMVAIPPDAVPGEIIFIAHDRGAADFLFMDPPIGNLGSATGFLGSQALVRKVLR